MASGCHSEQISLKNDIIMAEKQSTEECMMVLAVVMKKERKEIMTMERGLSVI